MISFIYGESGYGKTHAVIEMLKRDAQNGLRSFLILPEQYAVTGERMVLDALPPAAQLNIEILNFSRLYNRVCREYGGLEYNYITKPAKHLLMWKTVTELSPLLEHYRPTATDARLGELMLGAVDEFRAGGVSATELERAADKLGEGELRAKLRDMALIYSAYSAAVSENYSDSADDISKLFNILKEHDFFAGANVYIDSFTSFTAAEHSVIDRIFASADNTTVTLSLPRENFNSIYTESISLSERKLIRSAEAHGGHRVLILPRNMRAKTASLAYLSENLWDLRNNAPLEAEGDDGSVRLEICTNPYSEAEAAARWTLELMREGFRCRDICVVMRDAEKYRGIIEGAFERCGIPHFFSEKSDLCSKSCVKFILSALKIKNHSWRAGDVISHLKTGLYDIPREDIDLFEIYVSTWNISGSRFTDGYWTMNPDGYAREMTERGRRILTAANSVREYLCTKLLPLFVSLDAADDACEMSRAIYEYLVGCEVEEKLARIAAERAVSGNIKEAEEYSALYEVTLGALALVAEILGEEEMSTDELYSALDLVFSMTEIGTIPTSVDEVTIGSASTIRANNPKCVLVLGLCEGDFPQTVTDSNTLNTPERAVLATLGVELASNSDIKSSDELMFVKRAFSLPSEKLILFTCLSSADGRSKSSSLPYERTKKLLPWAREHIFNESDIEYLPISASGAAGYILSQENSCKAEALRRAIIEYSDEFSYLRDIRDVSMSSSDCSVSRETADKIFPNRMRLSQSRIEKYVRCNFSYYCSYVLGLREEKEARFGSADVGTFIHFVLEHLIKQVVTGKRGELSDIDDVTLCALVDEVVKRYIEYVCPQYERGTGRFVHLYGRLRNLSLLLVKNIISEFANSDFVPKLFEYKIGGSDSASAPEFVLSNGDRISLGGVIDRVDMLEKDDRVYIRIVDYKTGTKNFSIDDLALGLNTQMLIYLFALCAGRNRLPQIEGKTPLPAGVIYLSSNIPTLELEDYADSESVLAAAQKAFDRSGLLLNEEDILESMNKDISPDFLAGVKKDKNGMISGKALMSAEGFEELRTEIEKTIVAISEQMKSGKADAVPLIHKGTSPCDYCEMKPVCRRVERPTSELKDS